MFIKFEIWIIGCLLIKKIIINKCDGKKEINVMYKIKYLFV